MGQERHLQKMHLKNSSQIWFDRRMESTEVEFSTLAGVEEIKKNSTVHFLDWTKNKKKREKVIVL